MVDWKSPAVVAKSGQVFNRIVFALFGLYLWEWWSSLYFDWQLLSGKKRFRWPLVVYFLCRYFPLIFLITYVLQNQSYLFTHPPRCSAIYTIMHFAGSGCVALSSMTLALRARALWADNVLVKYGLLAIAVGQWAIIGAFSEYATHSYWVPGIGCHPGPADTRGDAAIFLYGLLFDLLTLCLALVKIIGTEGPSFPRRRHGQLRYVLFTQGLSYFVITSILNLVSIICFALNLNQVLIVIGAIPAEVIAALVACRMVRSLLSLADTEDARLLRFTSVDHTEEHWGE